jgi:hypothetical protein
MRFLSRQKGPRAAGSSAKETLWAMAVAVAKAAASGTIDSNFMIASRIERVMPIRYSRTAPTFKPVEARASEGS